MTPTLRRWERELDDLLDRMVSIPRKLTAYRMTYTKENAERYNALEKKWHELFDAIEAEKRRRNEVAGRQYIRKYKREKRAEQQWMPPSDFTCDDYTEAHERRRDLQEFYDDEFNKYIGARR